mgnify:CR=1 FL=1
MIRLALADDHQLVLDGLKSLIKEVDDFEFVAEATNGRRLVDIAKSLSLDVALVDIDMPVMNGLQAIKEISKENESIRCIALTMHNDPSMMRRVMSSGAKGYLLKNIDQEDLVEAIRKVHSGGEVSSEELDSNQHREGQEMNVDYQNPILETQLTDREIEILRLIAQGFSNKEIGDQLFISHRTVDTHRTNLMKKLDVHNIAGLIRYAIRSGYVE